MFDLGTDWTAERIIAVTTAIALWNQANTRAGVNIQFARILS
jgi:hypothetical protein